MNEQQWQEGASMELPDKPLELEIDPPIEKDLLKKHGLVAINQYGNIVD